MSLSVKVVAPASPEVTWSCWTDIGAWPRWNPMCTSATLSGPLSPGTELELELVHPRGRGRTFYTRPHLVAVEPYERIAWEATGPGLSVATETTLGAQPDGTLVTLTSSTTGRMSFSMRMVALGDRVLGRLYAAMLNALVAELRKPA